MYFIYYNQATKAQLRKIKRTWRWALKEEKKKKKKKKKKK